MSLLSRLAGLFRRAPAAAPNCQATLEGSRFDASLEHVLRHEGGWSDHPRDPGGATMRGITLRTFSDWRGREVSKEALRAISAEEVAAIYRARYWDAVQGDRLPPGVDLAVFDFAVNSGPGRAARTLQAALGVTMDGAIGPVTLAALASRDRAALVRDLCARRRAFLRGLGTYDTFGRGWERRVSEIEAAALEAAR